MIRLNKTLFEYRKTETFWNKESKISKQVSCSTNAHPLNTEKLMKMYWKDISIYVVQMHYHLKFSEESMSVSGVPPEQERVPENRKFLTFLSFGAPCWESNKFESKRTAQSHLHLCQQLQYQIWCWSIRCTSLQIKSRKEVFVVWIGIFQGWFWEGQCLDLDKFWELC